MGLLTQASVAIDGSKFKAVNNRDRNFTRAKMERRMAQIEESVVRYLQQLDTADRQEPTETLKAGEPASIGSAPCRQSMGWSPGNRSTPATLISAGRSCRRLLASDKTRPPHPPTGYFVIVSSISG